MTMPVHPSKAGVAEGVYSLEIEPLTYVRRFSSLVSRMLGYTPSALDGMATSLACSCEVGGSRDALVKIMVVVMFVVALIVHAQEMGIGGHEAIGDICWSG